MLFRRNLRFDFSEVLLKNNVMVPASGSLADSNKTSPS